MENKTIFTGAATAIITPLDENGINYEKFGRLVDWQIEEGIDAIVVCGTTGESSTLTDEEHKQAIDFVINRVNKRVPVIAGTGSNDTDYAIELTKYACKSGADGVLVVTPYYNKATQNGLIKMFSTIADNSTAPVILYNVPSRTGMNITIDTLQELSKLPNIVGVKDATGNISYTAELASKLPELAIYSGNDDMTIPVMSLGGKGVISVIANILPEDTHNMCQYYLDGDVEKARQLQLSMLD